MTSVPTTTASAARRPSAAPAQGRRRGVVVTVAVVAVAVTIVVSLSFGSRPVGAAQVVEGISMWFRGQTPTDIGLSLIHI